MGIIGCTVALCLGYGQEFNLYLRPEDDRAFIAYDPYRGCSYIYWFEDIDTKKI